MHSQSANYNDFHLSKSQHVLFWLKMGNNWWLLGLAGSTAYFGETPYEEAGPDPSTIKPRQVG